MLNLEIETVDFSKIKGDKLRREIKMVVEESYRIYKEKILRQFETRFQLKVKE